MNWRRVEAGALIISSCAYLACILTVRYLGEASPQSIMIAGLVSGLVMVLVAAHISFCDVLRRSPS